VFAEVRRVLRDDGTLWVNIGDSYAAGGLGGGSPDCKQRTNHGSCNGTHIEKPRKAPMGLKPKDLVGIPWRVAFALQADGWYLRSDIIWSKPNPMPESVTDRPTKAHEYLFLLAKSERYWYDTEAVKETAATNNWPGIGPKHGESGVRLTSKDSPYANGMVTHSGRNRRTVWEIPTQPYSEAHFATYPEKLVEPCVLAGCPEGGTVLDPFNGSGTTGAVACRLGRRYIGCELNPEYVALAHRRIGQALKPGTYRDESKATDAPLWGGAA
jgi:DNA modification methylase